MQEQVAIITGGAGSIGRGICLALAQKAVQVIVNYSKSKELAQDVVSEIKALGGQAVAIQADVTDASAVKAMIQMTLEKFKRLDILVNNAGIATANYVNEMSEAEWDLVMDTNLKGAFLCSRAVLPVLIEQHSGHIVNIASMVAPTGSYRHAHYAASKAGLIAFTKSLAREVGPYDICVNAISPGRIRSEMEADRQKREQAKWIAETPLGRMGEPRDVAETIVFLCSESASFITGENISVSGGLWMG